MKQSGVVGVRRLSPVQLVLTIMTGLLVVAMAILIMLARNNSSTSNTAIQSGYGLNDLVKIQRGILLLQIETARLNLFQESPEFDQVILERALLTNQIRLALTEAAGNTRLTDELGGVLISLEAYDQRLSTLESNPSTENFNQLLPEMDQILTDLEDRSKSFYNTEENLFFTNISTSLTAQTRYQSLLFGIGIVLLMFSVGLIISLRNTVSSEFARAYRLLEAENNERRKAEEELIRQNALLGALHETSLALMNRLDLDDLLSKILDRASKLIGSPNGFIALVNTDEQVIQIRMGTGLFSDVIGLHIAKGEGIAGTVWVSGETLKIEDYKSWSGRREDILSDRMHAAMGIPLKSEGLVRGVIALFFADADQRFKPQDAEMLEQFARLASISLDNARLYNSAQKEIAERKKVEEALRQAKWEAEAAQAEAEGANKAKTDFISVVTHELQSPMVSISGFTDLMLDDFQDETSDHREYLNIIRTNVRRMMALVTDLGDISQIEAGRIRFEPKPVDVREIVEDVLGSVKKQFEDKIIRVDVDIPADLPRVMSDRNRLFQALLNLLSNAYKYSENGKEILIRARVPLPGDDWGEDEIRISVQDQGFGMTPEDQEKVFMKFFRSDDKALRTISGTGLGLNITKQLVELQGGRIWFESQYGRGSTFYVAMPRAH